jgi:hypothetical protein
MNIQRIGSCHDELDTLKKLQSSVTSCSQMAQATTLMILLFCASYQARSYKVKQTVTARFGGARNVNTGI